MTRSAARRVVGVQLVVASVEGEPSARNPVGEAADCRAEVRVGMAQIVFGTGQTQHCLTQAAVAVRQLQGDQGSPEIGDAGLDSRGMRHGEKRHRCTIIHRPEIRFHYGCGGISQAPPAPVATGYLASNSHAARRCTASCSPGLLRTTARRNWSPLRCSSAATCQQAGQSQSVERRYWP